SQCAVGGATTWLQRRGLSSIARGARAVDVETEPTEGSPTRLELSHTLQDEAAIPQAAKRLGAKEVGCVNREGDYRAPLIAVRGVHVESGRLHWSGSAWSSTFETRPPQDTLAKLTCQALATAWNFRPPGANRFISSEALCTADQPVTP